MTARSVFKLLVAPATLISCMLWLTLTIAQTTPASFSINPSTLDFGDHDSGTSAAQRLTVTNSGDKSLNFSATILGSKPGDTPSDFSWKSTCLTGLPPNRSCEIIVLFSPAAIGKDKGEGEVRSAILVVTNDRGEHRDVSLNGRAFQNLNVTPTFLEFESQTGTSSAARTLTVTNFSNSTVNSIIVTAAGDFTENHAGCSTPLAPGGSCGILVSYSPKQAGSTSGALTIAANVPNLGSLPRLVSLHGVGLNRCAVPRFSWSDLGFWLVLSIIGLYFLGLVLVRWHMIAKPARAQLVAEIESVRARAVAETSSLPDFPELDERVARIHFLLDEAEYPFKHKNFPINPADQGRRNLPSPSVPPWHTWSTRFFNALFWTRGQELAGWSLAHEAEIQLGALLPVERVRARLETAEQQLKDMNTPMATALAGRIRESLTTGETLMAERATQLLRQFQMLVRQLSAQEAARQSWLADLQQRLLSFLGGIDEWAKKSAGASATLEDCRCRLQLFINTVSNYAGVASDLAQASALPSVPGQLRALLQEITSFFEGLRAPIQSIQSLITDTALTLDTCSKSLSSLEALGRDAGKLVQKLKDATPSDQGKVYQTFFDLCKSQASLVSVMTQTITPIASVAILQEVLAALKAQDELIQKINQAAASGAADFTKCRDLVFQLGVLPPMSSDLMMRIDCAVRGEPTPLATWRALLAEVLSLIYDSTDTSFSQLANWHNKMIWLVGCALLFMLALAVTLGNAMLLLVGAVGGLLSRLTRTTVAAEVPNDYGASWGSLFLSPLTGALAAWGGILLIILGSRLNILGSALSLDWCNPYEPVALAIALLFGFLERLFDSITGQLQDKLLKSPPSSPASTAANTTTPAPAPKIASLSPSSGTIGKEMQVTVNGANFQPGATATVTKDTGDAVSAKLDFKDATMVIVTFTPVGAQPFTATMTITNPDKQVATAKFALAAAS